MGPKIRNLILSSGSNGPGAFWASLPADSEQFMLDRGMAG